MITKAMEGQLDMEHLSPSQVKILEEIDQAIDEKIASFEGKWTGNLWLQYLQMINNIRQFIRVKWLGDLKLHLATLHQMLQWFALAGHHLYTKSVWLYLQQMSKLERDLPDVYNILKNGNHVVHTSLSSAWNGMGSDKAIECNK